MIDHDYDHDRARLDALDSYWDGVVAHTMGQAPTDDLDDDLAAAVRRLHAADGAPAAGAAFAERLWQELMVSAPPSTVPGDRSVRRRGVRLPGLPRRHVVSLLAVTAALLAALLAALVGVYPWGAPPTPVSANVGEIVRKSIVASSMRGAIHSFALTEKVTRRPGSSGLPLFAGYTGTVESIVTRWYEAPSRWRIERRYTIPPRGTLAQEYNTPGVRVSDGKVVQDYDERARTVSLQYPPLPSGIADLFPLGQGDAAPPGGQAPRALGDVMREATTCYTPTLQGDDRIAAQDAYVVDFERKGCFSASAYEEDGRLVLWIDKRTFFVLKSVLYEAGDRTKPYVTTEVTRVRYNPSIAASLFTFTPPLGATILGAPVSDAHDPRAVALARRVDFPLFVSGEALVGLSLRPPYLDARGVAHLAYAPSAGLVDARRGVMFAERQAAAADSPAIPSGVAPVLVGGGVGVVSGWYRQDAGGLRTVSFVRGGARVTLASALLPKDNLVELAGSLVPVAGGKPLQPNPTLRGLSALRSRIPFPIFVPTYVPKGLRPEEPALGPVIGVTVNYRTADGSVALTVLDGAAGCCIDQDARKGQDLVALPGGLVGHFMPNEPQFGGPILWVHKDGTFVAISGPALTRSEEIRIAASLSGTAGLRAG